MAQIYTGPTTHKSILKTAENAVNMLSSYTEQSVAEDEMSQYLRSANNVFQVFSGDYDNNKALRNLKSFQNSTNYDSFLNDIGLNDAQNKFNNFVLKSDPEGTIKGSDLSIHDIKQIKFGQTITVNGIEVGGFQNDITEQFSGLADKVINEKMGLAKLTGNKTDRIVAFNDVKNNAIKTIQGFDTLKNFNGSTMDCNKAIVQLNLLTQATNDTKEIAKLKHQIEILNTYKKNFASINVTPYGLSSAQKAGMSSIGRYALGGECMQGISTYRAAIKATSTLTRGSINLARNTVMSTAKAFTLGADMISRMPGLRACAKYSTFTGKARTKVTSADDFLKNRHCENKSARKSHTGKELRESRKINRIDKRTAKLTEKTKRAYNKSKVKTKQINKANPKSVKDALKANNRRKKLETKLAKRTDKFQTGKTLKARVNYRLVNGKYTGKVMSAKKWISEHNPIKFLNQIVGKLFGFFKKAKLILFATPGIILLLVAAIGGIVIIVLKFVSDLTDGTHLSDEFINKNYCQVCVDYVEGDLASSVLKVFKQEANQKYNVWDYINGNAQKNAVASDKYDWFKRATDGKIGSIVASEDHSLVLPSMNANVVPITSMMHLRYVDSINYSEYFTCEAYMSYMYVMSHRVYNEHIVNNPDCEIVYENVSPSNTVIWDESTHSITRGTLRCNNEYLHGYDASQYAVIAKSRRWAEETLISVLDWMNITNPALIDDACKNSGVWHSGYGEYVVPNDSHGLCNNYIQVRWDSVPTCNIPEHEHTDNCYETVEEEIPIKQVIMSSVPLVGEYYTTIATTPGYYVYLYSGTTTIEKRNLICTKEVHHHQEWTPEDHGCYDTAYICLGHCGGHVTPVLDVEIDTDYETLMYLDTFMTPSLIGSDSLNEVTSKRITDKCTNYKAYQDFWQAKMFSWFMPGPWSAKDALANVGKGMYETFCIGLDMTTQWLGDQVSNIFGMGTSIDTDTGTVDIEIPTENIDIFSFEGWTTPDGNINDDTLQNLISFYGTKFDEDGNGFYALAKQQWQDIGQVIFSDGMNRRLTVEQISNLVASINTTEINKTICQKALESCGEYWLNEQMTEKVTEPYGAANKDSWADYIYRMSTNKNLSNIREINSVHPGCLLYNEKTKTYAFYLGEISSDTLKEIPKVGNGSTWCITFDDDGVYMTAYKTKNWSKKYE